jgi:thioredoxin reductase (NADPH)
MIEAQNFFGLGFDPLSDTVAYPRLTESELGQLAGFGELCVFRKNEPLFCAGDYPFRCCVIISGAVRVIDVSTGARVVFVRYGLGHFTGDIDLLTRRPSVVSCEAETDVEARCLTLDDLRRMFTELPLLGATFWRSFQRRRELLLTSNFRGLTIYGDKEDKATLETVELLYRNSVPHKWMDASLPEVAQELVRLAPRQHVYPVVARGNDVLFEAPRRGELADYLGLRRRLPDFLSDVVIVGAGPAGLGAAVYAASEGLSTLVLDTVGPGGQAGATSRIENYAGFPDGISGQELSHQTYLQALKFGADFHVPSAVSGLERDVGGNFRLRTSEGDAVSARTVVVATGVSYRLLDVGGLNELEGPGVHYSATCVEARVSEDSVVHVVGAGNSAGQAAMFLSEAAREVSLLVRGFDLDKMSSYLSSRLLANKKVTVRFGAEVVGVEGPGRIRRVHVRGPNGKVEVEPTAGLFVFIGAKPRTEFLPDAVAKDERGFVLSGPDVAVLPSWTASRPPSMVETSLPGVFAAGDCRHGTTKRVAFAIGDGAAAVTALHDFAGSQSSHAASAI